jgi:hypothetical protein
MSYFAEIDEGNTVLRVLLGDDSAQNEGYDWFVENLGGTWVQAYSDGSIRKNFPSIGHSYDPDLDAFIPLKPYDSWLLDEETCTWQAPTPRPEGAYFWNEETLSWEEIPV